MIKSELKISALMLTPVVVASSIFLSTSAFADEVPTSTSLNRSVSVADLEQSTASNSSDTLGQVTSVSQLSDVQPTDWAFQALQSLVERYGCIAGYPNRTYRGNRPLTRYEFAAGLNACMDRVNELIASATADTVKKEDLEAIKKLQEEFGTELSTLRGQVDGLEARTKTLEAQQFSTTTKLNGEVIFALAQPFGSERAFNRNQARTNPSLQENTVFASRVRLNFDASFTGTDRLRVRLQAANIPNFNGVSNTDETRLAFDTNSSNNVQIDDLYYRFNPTPNTRIYVSAASSEFNDFFNVFNPGLDSSGSGALSRFGRFSSIYRSGEGSGIAVTQSFLDKKLVFNVGYLAGNQSSTANNTNAGQGAADPSNRNGLFNGNNSVLAQLEINPVKPLSIGLTYARAYQGSGQNGSNVPNLTGSIGSDLAQEPFGNVATRSNQFQVAANLKVTNRLTLTGSGTYVNAFADRTIAGLRRTDSADIWSWLGAISYKDLGRSGSNLAFIFGSPSGARRIDRSAADPDTAYHLELLYRLPITDNIAITPGFFTIINPESNSRNSTLYVGTIRTTFSF